MKHVGLSAPPGKLSFPQTTGEHTLKVLGPRREPGNRH
jgi:hypothetical protein